MKRSHSPEPSPGAPNRHRGRFERRSPAAEPDDRFGAVRVFGLPIAIVGLAVLALWPHPTRGLQADAPGGFRPVTQDILNNSDPADWMMWRRTYDNWGYSPLDQVNRDNVGELRLVWSYALEPGNSAFQAEPVVYDGIMYLRHPNEWHSAHDAATGDLRWEYRRNVSEEALNTRGITAHRGRGVFLHDDKVISHSTDGYIFALDAKSGELVWETEIADYRLLQQPSGAPVAFDGVVVVPYNCSAPFSMDRCHLSAYDADTGDLLWRWYTTPSADDPLNATWGPEPQIFPHEERRNTSPWVTPAVDPERGLFILGVGSSAPMQPELVGTTGEWPDRLFHGATVALDYRSGTVVWWAQHLSDMWNDDSVYDRILVDSPVDPDPDASLGVNPSIVPGESRPLMIGSFQKDGIFYAYDRSDGTFLYARETAPQNVILGYDGETGAFHTNPDVVMSSDLDHRVTVCHENRHIPQGAYSPLTNAYYAPIWSLCYERSTTMLDPPLDAGYNFRTLGSFINPESPTFGRPEAIDVATGKTLWRLDREAPLYGMLTTGGGLLFAADTHRRFYALDQWTGEVLWQTILSGLSDMAPISYAVDGRQYIAVISPGGTFARGHLARLGLRAPLDGHTLFVFALPEELP